ncbi:MAG: hypothetical protein ACRCYY_16710 [Trueperaceae bacterium]
MPYYSGIDYQTRQAVATLEEQFEAANSVEFIRDQHHENVTAVRHVLSWFLLASGVIVLLLSLNLETAQFARQTTYLMLASATVLVALFIYVDRSNLLIWLLGFLGAPILVAVSKVSFTPWVLVALLLIQVGLLLSGMGMHQRAALHLLLLWEFCLGGFLLYLTKQPVFVMPVGLAVVSGFRVYGVAKTFRGLFALVVIMSLFALTASLPFAQILLILATPALYFFIFR